MAWLDVSPHAVKADLLTGSTTLVLIDHGSTQAEFRYGARAMSCEFMPGSIGLFTAGTELKASRWKWTRTRRIYLDLGAGLPGGMALTESMLRMPGQTEIEFHDADLLGVIRSMADEVRSGCPHGKLFAESLSLGVAMRLHARASARLGGSRERGKMTAAQVRAVQDLVYSQTGKNVSLAEMAAAARFSPAQFVRLFRNTLGCTPYQYVLKMRLARARDMVVTSDLPLSDIAEETGFASQSHMTSAFVREFKSPPGDMRRRWAGGHAK